MLLHRFASPFIILKQTLMLPTIKFDYDFLFDTREVHDIFSYRVLATEAVITDLFSS